MSNRRKTYEPRECYLCGTMFVPTHGCKKMCDECTDVIYHNKGRRLPRVYENPTNLEKYEEGRRARYNARYKDNIVAIGYADRQRAKTLAMVSKIKVEL